jgi:hypothetical protein
MTSVKRYETGMKLSLREVFEVVLPRVSMSGMTTDHWVNVITACALAPNEYVQFFYPESAPLDTQPRNWPRSGGRLSQAPDSVSFDQFVGAAMILSGKKLGRKSTERERFLASLIEHGVVQIGVRVIDKRFMASHESIARAIEILNEQEADEGPLPPGLAAARRMLRDRLQELARPSAGNGKGRRHPPDC